MSERLSPSWRPQRRDSLFDPQVIRMALMAGGAAAVLAAVVGGYRLLSHAPRTVPVIEADSRPIRVKPDNPGGMQIAGADETGGAAGEAEIMAPAPEAPQPQALKAQIAAARQAAPAVPAPAPASAPLPAPAAMTPPVSKPVAKPAPVPAPVQPGGRLQVQLAAMETEQGATAEWQRLTRLVPAAFAGRKPDIQTTVRDGKTFYRVRTGGFADAAQMGAFCAQVKAKGGGCSPAG